MPNASKLSYPAFMRFGPYSLPTAYDYEQLRSDPFEDYGGAPLPKEFLSLLWAHEFSKIDIRTYAESEETGLLLVPDDDVLTPYDRRAITVVRPALEDEEPTVAPLTIEDIPTALHALFDD